MVKVRVDESIMAQDEATYTHGIIPISGKLYLSNQRLFFYTKGINKLLVGQNIELELDKIDELEEKSNGFTVRLSGDVYKFSGTGAQRIFDRISVLYKSIKGEQINLTDTDILNEHVFLQGDIHVFLRFGFSSPGHIILSQNRLKIECIPSLTSKIVSPKNINTHIDNIQSFIYNPTKRTLSIIIEEDRVESTVSVSGKLCAKLSLYIQAIHDGNFTKGTIHDVILYQGLVGGLSLSVSGHMLLSNKHLLFCCTSITDNLIGATNFAIPLRKIKQVEVTGWSMEPKIHVQTTDGETVILGTSQPQYVFQSFYTPLCSANVTPPFRDTRYFPKISQSRAQRKLKKLGFVLKEKENAQLIDWVIYKTSGSKIELGWLLLTSDRLCFIDLIEGVHWESPIHDLQNNSNRQNDPIIRLLSNMQKKIFIPQGGSHFTKQMWSIIIGIQPEQDGKQGRSGQSLRRVLGRFHVLNIFEDEEDGRLLLSTENIEIAKHPESLRIMISAQPTSPLTIGQSFTIEVPCNEGRFRFSSIIREDYIAEPDPIGRYYITISIPSDISVYNQRRSFRVPFSNPVFLEIFSYDKNIEKNYKIKKEIYQPSKEEEDEENITPEELLFDDDIQKNFLHPNLLEHLATKQSQFYDISLGGCSVSLLEDLNDTLRPLDRLFFYMEIPFSKESVPILAKVINQRRSYDNPNYMIYGCQFFNISQPCGHFLKIGVLELERDQVRSMISMEELNEIE